MTKQIDTAAKVINRYAEEHDLVLTSRQCLWFASAILDQTSTSDAQSAAEMFVMNDGLDITSGEITAIISAVDTYPDQTGPFVSGS